MSESLHSEIQTRFSTPVSDLDDHRHQPEALPRADGPRNGSRRGTFVSVVDQRPDLGPPALNLEYGMVARDFEHAIDDDQSIRSGRSAASKHHKTRVARRSTFRRPHPDMLPRSRDSSSSRSTSPPNSVDAFAPPARRRGRAGTITSHISGSNVSLQRTISSGTHGRRRGTVSEHIKSPDIRGEEGPSRRSSVEDDVCFPPPEDNTKTYTIDFEELEEFVAQSHQKTPASHPFTSPNGNHHFGAAAHHLQELGTRIFHDLRGDKGDHDQACDSGKGESEAMNEKMGVDDDPKNHDSSDDGTKFEVERPTQRAGNLNRWTFFSSEIDETIHAPELGGLLMPNETFRDLFELGPDGGVWWMDMLNPSEEEVIAVCKAFGVHPLTREDITTQETREKVELFRSYYFVCFRSFYQEAKDSEMEAINIYAVVFREGLLTFSFCPNPHAANVRKRIGRLRDYVNLSADWICYALIDEIVDAFGPVIRDVEHEADAIEDNVFIARFEDSRTILRQIGECRKKVMSLIRLLGGKADVIKGFAKRCNDQYSVAPRGDVGLYLSDVQDHVVTMMGNLSHFEKMLSRSHSNYLAQISVDNIAQGNKANGLLHKVTLIATILVPLNLIAGLFGMNVPVPGKNAEGLGWFFGIVGVILGFSLACTIAMKRLKYI